MKQIALYLTDEDVEVVDRLIERRKLTEGKQTYQTVIRWALRKAAGVPAKAPKKEEAA
jgi:hypothetical protein